VLLARLLRSADAMSFDIRHPSLLLACGAAALWLGCESGQVGSSQPIPGEEPVIRLRDSGPGPMPVDAGARPPPATDSGTQPGEPPPPTDPCGGLDFRGVCDGADARWCAEGEIRSRDCGASGQACGWVDDTTGYYCGGDPGGGPRPPPDSGGDAGTTPPSPTGCGGTVENEELALTNQARRAAGLSELACDDALTRAARLHSQDMCDRGYFSHRSRDGRSFTDRLDAQGASYGSAGENIAMGQQTPNEVHQSWMGSSGHRANILSGSYHRIGIGYVSCGGRPLWTQDFTD